jgi:hypothetical protein
VMIDRWNDIKLLTSMQNQQPYVPYQPKLQMQGPTKLIDRAIPSFPPKHTASNPNLSLDFTPKPHFDAFRGLPLAQPPASQYARPRHGDLARSMILPQQESQP